MANPDPHQVRGELWPRGDTPIACPTTTNDVRGACDVAPPELISEDSVSSPSHRSSTSNRPFGPSPLGRAGGDGAPAALWGPPDAALTPGGAAAAPGAGRAMGSAFAIAPAATAAAAAGSGTDSHQPRSQKLTQLWGTLAPGPAASRHTISGIPGPAANASWAYATAAVASGAGEATRGAAAHQPAQGQTGLTAAWRGSWSSVVHGAGLAAPAAALASAGAGTAPQGPAPWPGARGSVSGSAAPNPTPTVPVFSSEAMGSSAGRGWPRQPRVSAPGTWTLAGPPISPLPTVVSGAPGPWEPLGPAGISTAAATAVAEPMPPHIPTVSATQQSAFAGAGLQRAGDAGGAVNAQSPPAAEPSGRRLAPRRSLSDGLMGVLGRAGLGQGGLQGRGDEQGSAAEPAGVGAEVAAARDSASTLSSLAATSADGPGQGSRSSSNSSSDSTAAQSEGSELSTATGGRAHPAGAAATACTGTPTSSRAQRASSAEAATPTSPPESGGAAAWAARQVLTPAGLDRTPSKSHAGETHGSQGLSPGPDEGPREVVPGVAARRRGPLAQALLSSDSGALVGGGCDARQGEADAAGKAGVAVAAGALVGGGLAALFDGVRADAEIVCSRTSSLGGTAGGGVVGSPETTSRLAHAPNRRGHPSVEVDGGSEAAAAHHAPHGPPGKASRLAATTFADGPAALGAAQAAMTATGTPTLNAAVAVVDPEPAPVRVKELAKLKLSVRSRSAGRDDAGSDGGTEGGSNTPIHKRVLRSITSLLTGRGSTGSPRAAAVEAAAVSAGTAPAKAPSRASAPVIVGSAAAPGRVIAADPGTLGPPAGSETSASAAPGPGVQVPAGGLTAGAVLGDVLAWAGGTGGVNQAADGAEDVIGLDLLPDAPFRWSEAGTTVQPPVADAGDLLAHVHPHLVPQQPLLQQQHQETYSQQPHQPARTGHRYSGRSSSMDGTDGLGSGVQYYAAAGAISPAWHLNRYRDTTTQLQQQQRQPGRARMPRVSASASATHLPSVAESASPPLPSPPSTYGRSDSGGVSDAANAGRARPSHGWRGPGGARHVSMDGSVGFGTPSKGGVDAGVGPGGHGGSSGHLGRPLVAALLASPAFQGHGAALAGHAAAAAGAPVVGAAAAADVRRSEPSLQPGVRRASGSGIMGLPGAAVAGDAGLQGAQWLDARYGGQPVASGARRQRSSYSGALSMVPPGGDRGGGGGTTAFISATAAAAAAATGGISGAVPRRPSVVPPPAPGEPLLQPSLASPFSSNPSPAASLSPLPVRPPLASASPAGHALSGSLVPTPPWAGSRSSACLLTVPSEQEPAQALASAQRQRPVPPEQLQESIQSPAGLEESPRSMEDGPLSVGRRTGRSASTGSAASAANPMTPSGSHLPARQPAVSATYIPPPSHVPAASASAATPAGMPLPTPAVGPALMVPSGPGAPPPVQLSRLSQRQSAALDPADSLQAYQELQQQQAAGAVLTARTSSTSSVGGSGDGAGGSGSGGGAGRRGSRQRTSMDSPRSPPFMQDALDAGTAQEEASLEDRPTAVERTRSGSIGNRGVTQSQGSSQARQTAAAAAAAVSHQAASGSVLPSQVGGNGSSGAAAIAGVPGPWAAGTQRPDPSLLRPVIGRRLLPMPSPSCITSSPASTPRAGRSTSTPTQAAASVALRAAGGPGAAGSAGAAPLATLGLPGADGVTQAAERSSVPLPPVAAPEGFLHSHSRSQGPGNGPGSGSSSPRASSMLAASRSGLQVLLPHEVVARYPGWAPPSLASATPTPTPGSGPAAGGQGSTIATANGGNSSSGGDAGVGNAAGEAQQPEGSGAARAGGGPRGSGELLGRGSGERGSSSEAVMLSPGWMSAVRSPCAVGSGSSSEDGTAR